MYVIGANTYNYTGNYFGEVFTEELKSSGTKEPSFISIDKTGSKYATVIISDYKESKIPDIGFKETP